VFAAAFKEKRSCIPGERPKLPHLKESKPKRLFLIKILALTLLGQFHWRIAQIPGSMPAMASLSGNSPISRPRTNSISNEDRLNQNLPKVGTSQVGKRLPQDDPLEERDDQGKRREIAQRRSDQTHKAARKNPHGFLSNLRFRRIVAFRRFFITMPPILGDAGGKIHGRLCRAASRGRPADPH
jgi:hypothetical protein